MRINKPMIGAFLETHAQQSSLPGILNNVVPGWSFDANYSDEADNGRIVVVWDPILSVFTYFKSPQLMLCGVFNPRSGQSFTAAFVYARNRREERVSLWASILQLSASPLIKNSPWIILEVDFFVIITLFSFHSL